MFPGFHHHPVQQTNHHKLDSGKSKLGNVAKLGPDTCVLVALRPSHSQRNFLPLYSSVNTFITCGYLHRPQGLIVLSEFPMADWLMHTSRAGGSNLWMVRPSLMSVVKLLIICMQSTWQKFGTIFSSQEVLSFHFSFKLGATITLFS